jgi:ATP-dependent helicase HrpA
MNVRVTDAEGRPLASGRDLAALRRELGSQAAESLSQLDDPRWNRDGLAGWDFDELPAEVELPRGRIALKAYPTLRDCGESVALRLVDSPIRAEYETRLGLRRLCLLATQGELKTQVNWLPNLDRMELYTATLPGFELRQRLAELLAERAMLADQPVPRTKHEFERLLGAGRERVAWAVQELIALAKPLFEGYHRTCLALEEFARPVGATAAPAARKRGGDAPPASPSQYALDDIRQQIGRLMEPRFFSAAPWDWLRQYPRYFHAARVRLENLPGGVPRDWEKFQEFQPHWHLYLEHLRHHQSEGLFDRELTHLGWMLEEYRVSLFAQRLGTAIPVSLKRLEQQWAKLQG